MKKKKRSPDKTPTYSHALIIKNHTNFTACYQQDTTPLSLLRTPAMERLVEMLDPQERINFFPNPKCRATVCYAKHNSFTCFSFVINVSFS
jgi:hypothetical protein